MVPYVRHLLTRALSYRQANGSVNFNLYFSPFSTYLISLDNDIARVYYNLEIINIINVSMSKKYDL